jgi:hypothetical protein
MSTLRFLLLCCSCLALAHYQDQLCNFSGSLLCEFYFVSIWFLVCAHYAISPDLYFALFIVFPFFSGKCTLCKPAFQFLRISTLRLSLVCCSCLALAHYQDQLCNFSRSLLCVFHCVSIWFLVCAHCAISPDLYFAFFITFLFMSGMCTLCEPTFQFLRISTLRF